MSLLSNSTKAGSPLPPRSRGGKDGYVEISIDRLKAGVQTQAAILDGDGRLLLAAGFTISASVINKLRQRGISRIRVREDELERLTGGGGDSSQRPTLARGPVRSLSLGETNDKHAHLSAAERPFRNQIQAHGEENYNPSLLRRCAELRHSAENLFFDLHRRANGIGRAEKEQLACLSKAGLGLLAADCDAFASGSLLSRGLCDENRRDAVVRCCDLACSIAVRLNMSTMDLIDLNLGITLYYLATLDSASWGVPTPNAPGSIESVHRSVKEWLGRSTAVSSSSRLVALQMDERFDGSGGPRKLIGSQIHPFTRIAAVARTYVELVAPTVNREPAAPYNAMTILLRETHRGRFDPNVTRAFLHTSSLFPLGSCFQLSNGSVGRSIRSRDADYTHPVMETWPSNDLTSSPQVVDLSRVEGISVTRTLTSLSEAPPAGQPHLDLVSKTPKSELLTVA